MFELARPFLLSLSLGLVIGIERERALADRAPHLPFGSRTFTLLALLGTLTAHLGSTPVAIVIALTAGALIVVAYARTASREGGHGVGATTEVAAAVVFGLGYLAHSQMMLTLMLAVIVLLVLALKPRIHEFAHEGLTPAEVNAALTFLVISFVALPLLPDRTIDPWGLVNPFRLWLLFVLIAGIGFAGYIAVRAFGTARGFAVAGFFAGLVSSTAASLALSEKSRPRPDWIPTLATGIVLANVASAAAQLLVVSLANPAMLADAVPVIGAPVLTGAVLTALYIAWRRAPHTVSEPGSALEAGGSPLALRPAATFAVGIAVLLAVVGLAERYFGSSGVLVTAAIGGSADVHAMTLAVATLAGKGDLPVDTALQAMVLGFEANMAVKLGIVAWAGGMPLVRRTAPPMIAMMVAAAAALAL